MKLLLIILLIVFVLFNKKMIEPIIPDNCCGDMKLNRDYKETDINPPVKYRRCFKPVFINGSVDGYEGWDTMPCTTNTDSACCGGEENTKCRPSKYGGICKKDDGDDFIYDTTDGKKVTYNKDIHDINVVTNRSDNNINISQTSDNINLSYIFIGFGVLITIIIIAYLLYSNKVISDFNPFPKMDL